MSGGVAGKPVVINKIKINIYLHRLGSEGVSAKILPPTRIGCITIYKTVRVMKILM